MKAHQIACCPRIQNHYAFIFGEKPGQFTCKEVVKERSTDFGSEGESSRVIVEKDERGGEGGATDCATDGAGNLFSCRIGHLGRRWYSLPHR